MYTKILVENILKHPLQFDWSRQGLGMLRIYLSEEVRLHIWDSSLKISGASPIHDHPWDLESLIVVGRMRQHRYIIPEYNIPAYAQKFNYAVFQCGEKAHTTETPTEVSLVEEPLEIYTEGMTYTQKKDEIHWSMPEDGTVTIVKRTFHEDRDHARIFWRGKGGWISAEPRPATKEEIELVTRRSLEMWF